MMEIEKKAERLFAEAKEAAAWQETLASGLAAEVEEF